MPVRVRRFDMFKPAAPRNAASSRERLGLRESVAHQVDSARELVAVTGRIESIDLDVEQRNFDSCPSGGGVGSGLAQVDSAPTATSLNTTFLRWIPATRWRNASTTSKFSAWPVSTCR